MLFDELLAEAHLADLDRDVVAIQAGARRRLELQTGARSPAHMLRGGRTVTEVNELPLSRSDVGKLGEGTPGFVARRRTWLHRLLAAQRDARAAELP
jgi:hypothetical protein